MMNNNQINMQFDFTEDGSSTGPLLFSNPVHTITAHQPSDVPACLKQIDKAVEAGFYAAGYVSYEALPVTEKVCNQMPLLTFGIFNSPVDQIEVPKSDAFQIGKWRMMESKSAYAAHFMKIMQAIHREDIEEINYTVSFTAPFSGNAYRYYEQLREAQASKYCAYLSIEGYEILSASPELFYHLEADTITVRPMKGTIHRGLTYEEDLEHQTWLRTSKKNRLENKLTLDLMEKELEQVTIPGSIQAVDKYRVEKYPTLYQMTSGLTGSIAPDKSLMEIMQALFPCGSITGVPKTAGMQLIRELESFPREVYCGAIGYITPEKKAVFNVPIRTVWIDREKEIAHYGAGGAITRQSVMEEEYGEVQTKTDVLTWKEPAFDLLETIGLYNGSYIVLDEHIKRLHHSAAYFNFPIHSTEIEALLEKKRSANAIGHWRVRLTVSRDGINHLTIAPLNETESMPFVRLARRPIDKKNRYLYHKTTNRRPYETHTEENQDVFDVLLWNEEGDITEFTIGNVVVELNGALYTPPVSSGLLPGTFRAQLLKTGVITERRIAKDELKNSERLWLVNSLRKWVEVHLV